MISERENYLRAVEFRSPEWVPIEFPMLPAVVKQHGESLRQLMLKHPRIFPPDTVEAVMRPCTDPLYTAGSTYVDDWGCLWRNEHDGVLGRVVSHPLEDWAALDSLKVPDPGRQTDWPQVAKYLARHRSQGRLAHGYMSIVKGGFFDRMQFLRGMENLLVDLMLEPPELSRMIEMLLDYNMKALRLWLQAGVECLCFHGDIGTQRGLMMSPAVFRKHIKPAYKEMFQACRRAGVHVKYSSDGNLLEIVDDMIECGVSLHDPQVGACGIDGIAGAYKGRLCAMVDLDEQALPFLTAAQIDAQVREIVQKVASPRGGLMLFISPSRDVSLENIEACCLAWEKHCT